MKDARGHGSNARGGGGAKAAAHQTGVGRLPWKGLTKLGIKTLQSVQRGQKGEAELYRSDRNYYLGAAAATRGGSDIGSFIGGGG